MLRLILIFFSIISVWSFIAVWSYIFSFLQFIWSKHKSRWLFYRHSDGLIEMWHSYKVAFSIQLSLTLRDPSLTLNVILYCHISRWIPYDLIITTAVNHNVNWHSVINTHVTCSFFFNQLSKNIISSNHRYISKIATRKKRNEDQQNLLWEIWERR